MSTGTEVITSSLSETVPASLWLRSIVFVRIARDGSLRSISRFVRDCRCLFCAPLNCWDQSFVLTLFWWLGLCCVGSIYADLIVLESLQGQRRLLGVSSSALPMPTDVPARRAAPLSISFDSPRIISINYQVDKTTYKTMINNYRGGMQHVEINWC